MSEFKGTKGKLELKYVSGVCIGIGTIGDYSQITCNTILPETDEEYEQEKTEIEANMLLYSKAPEMLEMLNTLLEIYKTNDVITSYDFEKIEKLIKEATE